MPCFAREPGAIFHQMQQQQGDATFATMRILGLTLCSWRSAIHRKTTSLFWTATNTIPTVARKETVRMVSEAEKTLSRSNCATLKPFRLDTISPQPAFLSSS